jgi:hypothetical protein
MKRHSRQTSGFTVKLTVSKSETMKTRFVHQNMMESQPQRTTTRHRYIYYTANQMSE